ncbi:MAG TPA: hypothetical protein VLA19_07995, partial [Herpetosiphonaceae bacterium]|nr:hypothetical protein [Herpetosiphonaceae bacterium]
MSPDWNSAFQSGWPAWGRRPSRTRHIAHMPPGLSRADQPDGRLPYSVPLGEDLGRFGAGADLTHLTLGQPGLVMLFAAWYAGHGLE